MDLAYGVRVALVALVLYLERYRLPTPSWPASWHAPAIGAVTFGLWWILIPQRAPADVELYRAELASLSPLAAAGWIGVRVLGSCLIVPIAEELAGTPVLYFPVVQECEKGVHRWIEIPTGKHAEGHGAGSAEPAAALRLLPKK